MHNLTDVYGVMMTSIQEMMFAKWRAINGVAMNTLTEVERKKLSEEWLKNHFDNQK